MKSYSILDKRTNQCYFSFSANEDQAKVIHALRFDTDATELIEEKPFSVNDIQVMHAFDQEGAKVFSISFPDEDIHVLILSPKECYLLDDDLYRTDNIDFKDLMKIPAFSHLAKCKCCGNTGFERVVFGDHEEYKECECEEANAYLQEMYNSL